MEINLEKRVNIITGHYGCGKTNLSVNLAIDLAKQGKKVFIIDLDIVNPYFKSADFKHLFEEYNIECIFPLYANTNLDVPVYSNDIQSIISNAEGYVILDLGGDDVGATILGQFYDLIKELDYNMYYTFNVYRYNTQNPEGIFNVMSFIERNSRLKVKYLINNSNVGDLTTQQDILDSFKIADEVKKLSGLDIAFTSIKKDLCDNFDFGSIYPINIYRKSYW